jgi:hypothetical protein
MSSFLTTSAQEVVRHRGRDAEDQQERGGDKVEGHADTWVPFR